MTTNNNESKIAISIIAITALIYLFFILRYTVNIPYEDDYAAILDFLNHFKQTPDLLDKIKSILSQHNEHRIAFNRLIELIQLNALGEINFSYLTFFGNIGWFLAIYLLWIFSKRNQLSLLEFSPVVILLLSFSHNELMPWAMASIQQYYQILFSLLAIWFLVERKNIAAFLWLIASVFTGSGGLVLIPVFALYYIAKKEPKDLLAFLVAGSILLAIFFIGLDYHSPPYHPSIIDALRHPIDLSYYFFVFLGSAFGAKKPALVVGVILCVTFLINAKRTANELPFAFWSVIFILGAALLTGLARSGFGIDQALSSRYTQYSLMLMAFVYIQSLHALEYKKRKILSNSFLFFSIALFITWLVNGGSVIISRQAILKHNGVFYIPDNQVAEEILKISYKNGYLRSLEGINLPSRLFDAKETGISNEYCLGINGNPGFCSSDKDAQHADKVLVIPSHQKTININGWTVDNHNQSSACGVYAMLGDKKTSFILDERKDVAKLHNNPKYLLSGFNVNMDISNLPDGTYPFTLRTVSSGCDSYYDSFEISVVKGATPGSAAPTQNQ